ncbi:hypothetical protein BH24ACT4_BH24ACT4_04300 [soil metagenome]
MLAVTAGGVATVVLTRSDGSGWCDALAARAFDGQQVIVFMDPGADEAAVSRVSSRLRADPTVTTARYYDDEAALAEARWLFADQPDVLDALPTDGLPTSFRALVADDAAAAAVQAAATDWPQVQQVEVDVGAGGSGETTRMAHTDRVIDRIDVVAAGGPAEASSAALVTLADERPSELARPVRVRDPVLDPERAAVAPSAEDRSAAGALVRSARDDCDLRPG